MSNLGVRSVVKEVPNLDKRITNLVGKIVRYKRHLLTPEFLMNEGEWARDCVYHVIGHLMEDGEILLKAKIAKCSIIFKLNPSNVELVSQ